VRERGVALAQDGVPSDHGSSHSAVNATYHVVAPGRYKLTPDEVNAVNVIDSERRLRVSQDTA
jgi:hypothetical protein